MVLTYSIFYVRYNSAKIFLREFYCHFVCKGSVIKEKKTNQFINIRSQSYIRHVMKMRKNNRDSMIRK